MEIDNKKKRRKIRVKITHFTQQFSPDAAGAGHRGASEAEALLDGHQVQDGVRVADALRIRDEALLVPLHLHHFRNLVLQKNYLAKPKIYSFWFEMNA